MKKLITITIAVTVICSSLPIAALDSTLKHNFQKTVQLFGYSCHEMASAKKPKNLQEKPLLPEYLAVVETVEDSFRQLIKQTSDALESSDSQVQNAAVTTFGNYVLKLAHSYGLRNRLMMSIAPSLDTWASIESQISTISQAVNALARYYATIRPQPTLHTRIAHKLFYNYTTTKIAPNLLKYVIAPVAAYTWTKSMRSAYLKEVQADKTKSFWQTAQKCTVPTKAEAQKDLDIKTAALKDALKTYIPKSSWYYIQKNQQELTRQLNRQNFDIDNFLSSLRGYTYDNPISQMHERDDVARPLLKQVQELYKEYRNSQVNHYEANKHKHGCEIPIPDKQGKAQERGKHMRLWISTNLTAQENAINAGIFTGKIAWALRPLYLILGANKLSNYLQKIQSEQYNRKEQHALDRMPIDKALKNIIVHTPGTKLFGPAASEQHMINNGYASILESLKNPLNTQNNGILLHGTNDDEKRLILNGLATETKSIIISLAPLAASKLAHVKATIEKALDLAVRQSRSVIINLEDAEYIAQDSRALNNIKEVIFTNRNPYTKITVIATATNKDKMAPELMTYLPLMHEIA